MPARHQVLRLPGRLSGRLSSCSSTRSFSCSAHSTPIWSVPSAFLRTTPSASSFHSSSIRAAQLTGGGGSGGPFEPLRPPSPSSLGVPRRAREFRRSKKWARRLAWLSLFGGAVYLLDRYRWASGMARSLRTFGTGLVVALDYKINFRPDPLPFIGTADLTELHRRNAERLSEVLRANGGLYLKMGQAIAMQSAVLPPEFQRMFARMFDDAPQDDWAAIERVIREDFGGRSVEDVFGVSFDGDESRGVMERTARASASVAQVHWARLADGREVAVKIQKPEIRKQIGWDLWSFKVVAWLYTAWFDLPLYSFVPFITERLMLETDFVNEAENSETMRRLVASDPSLRGRVYVPAVYRELSSDRVLTAEWIEGARLWDREALTRPWTGGRGRGSPGVHGAPLEPPDMAAVRRQLRGDGTDKDTDKTRLELKPERGGWRGPHGKGGLGLSTAEVMTTMVQLFSAMIFRWGLVHADPHSGNLFVRRLPSGRAELVLIDHGLYVQMTDKFRHEYGLFWKSLMAFDNQTMVAICREWGIGGADMFASATLMRPYEGGDESFRRGVLLGEGEPGAAAEKTQAQRSYEMQRRMKRGMRELLEDEDKWPKELIFIGRTMRILQANNQYLGSPVNRVKLMGNAASASLYEDPALPWRSRLRNAWRHALFRAVMAASDVAFYFFWVRQRLGLGGGMEDEVEARMRDMAKGFGVELQHDVFEG